ncbi:hypothetical protein [Desulfitobacterium sp.]|uniref:hypothetical protein n=1 Tax=Desulfitobacterium sp. TaxID=49981 RepID=UPI002B1F068B|nr:hypothetical protein [Desulfitobacterium sp.]MEA4902060.1 hypothetical protein [Desulfitobacterium sp.]
MKMKKKTTMILSFALGGMIFATTALADIASKDGYDQFKDTIKYTAEQCSETLDTYTVDSSFVLKDNGKILSSENQIAKIDIRRNAQENTSTREDIVNGKSMYLTYSDPTIMIRQNSSDPIFYVTEYTKPRKNDTVKNPFKEDRVEDAEKVIDAFVGSLRDQVIVKENTDGTKNFTGTISEVQIPTVVNAIASYALKQETANNSSQVMMPLAKDIYIKEVHGIANVNTDGLLEDILGTATIVGLDKEGNSHEITLEALIKFSDINSTVVTKPDLTGQKVKKQVITADSDGFQSISNPEKFIGRFNNDIIIEDKGKYVKIGERIIEITEIDSNHVAGKYYEKYKPGFEDKAVQKEEFDFDAPFNNKENGDPHGAEAEITNNAGGKTQIHLHLDEQLGKIHFSFDRGSGNYFDSSFSPVLE